MAKLVDWLNSIRDEFRTEYQDWVKYWADHGARVKLKYGDDVALRCGRDRTIGTVTPDVDCNRSGKVSMRRGKGRTP